MFFGENIFKIITSIPGLILVVAFYAVLLLLPTAMFMTVAIPEGWPTKSFFNDVPVHKQEPIL
jgi:hypothetical protein